MLAAAERPPVEHYGFFLLSLMRTVRLNIAECASAAYQTLSVTAATKLLMFHSAEETKAFIAENQPDWLVGEDGVINLGKQRNMAAVRVESIPSLKLIQQQLTYASELERIV